VPSGERGWKVYFSANSPDGATITKKDENGCHSATLNQIDPKIWSILPITVSCVTVCNPLSYNDSWKSLDNFSQSSSQTHRQTDRQTNKQTKDTITLLSCRNNDNKIRYPISCDCSFFTSFAAVESSVILALFINDMTYLFLT